MPPSKSYDSPSQDTLAYAETQGPAPKAELHVNSGTVVKHYEIIRKLGAGGMGAVFLARDTRLGRLVAIKFLLEFSGAAAQRFLAEARATARCRHDNIVVIYDVDELQGSPYMVLEYIEGRTLQAFMQERTRIETDDESNADAMRLAPMVPLLAIELLLPVVRALECAHAMGIVHRDLKPGNIFLSDAGQIKVLDFGLAKQTDIDFPVEMGVAQTIQASHSALTQAGAIMGTMPYMAPEQWEGQGIDARTDIWAVGLMLYELVTGVHPLMPFSRATLEMVRALDKPMPRVIDELPEAGPIADVIDRCLAKRKEDRFGSARELLGALEALVRGQDSSALAKDESPFAGLSAFQEADAARFFGREQEIAAMVAKLRQQELVAIAGPSGAGKSSFVRAGIIPALKRSIPELEAFVVRPGRRPLTALADVLAFLHDTSLDANAADADVETIAATIRTQPGYLGAKLRARCRKQGPNHRIVLFVDQLEELYTLGTEASERAAFAACIEGVADDASSPLRVLLTLRADFLDRLAEDRRLLSKVTHGLVFLPPMTREALRDSMTKPLETARYAFEDEALCHEMLDGLMGTKSPLPLLQFTATKLWETRDQKKRILSREAYHALGGVAGALSTHADSVLAGLSLPEQRIARSVLLRLVTPEGTRAIVQMEELLSLDHDGAAVEQLVLQLANARLVLIESGGAQHGKTVELTHESLIESWGKLRQWLNENEQDAQYLAQLRNAATQWEKSGEVEGLLWRDRAAIDAGQWLEKRRANHGAESTGGLGKREERYLEAVVRLAEQTRRRRRQLIGGSFAFLSLIAVVVSVLALQARSQGAQAQNEAMRADAKAIEAEKSAAEARKNADEANRRAAEARNATRMASAGEHLSDPTLVLALMREMEPIGQLPARWRELALWAKVQGVARVIFEHTAIVDAVAFSPDGRYVLTATNKTAQICNADGIGNRIVFEGHQRRIRAAAWSPDGERIVTASEDNTVRVWNAKAQRQPLVLQGHRAAVLSVAFNADGTRIVTGSSDKTARVWNADGTGEPLVLEHPDGVAAVGFSPDGRHIVTGSSDKTARVWNADGTGDPLVLEGHQDNVVAASFSPDGQRIVTASWDRTARVWNADGTGKPLVLEGHQDAVRSVAWSPDGQRIVTSSWDRTARVWNANGKGRSLLLEGHQAALFSAAFSPDGKSVITGSWDRTARIWNIEGVEKPLVFEGSQDRVSCAAWSPDGQRIVTSSWDKVARIWNADGTGKPILFEGHQDKLSSASFSPDGQRIVTGSSDRTARVWNANGKGTPIVFKGHDAGLWSVSFSPDGKKIVTGSWDKTARVWNADGTGEPIVLSGHQDSVVAASFSPDGQRVLTASLDKTARIWNADGIGEPTVIKVHGGGVWSAAFSPDGKRIVTTSGDKMIRVWNSNGEGQPIVVLDGNSEQMQAGTQGGQGAWSPDGTQIATISDDQTIRLWNADGTGEPAVLRNSGLDVFSAAFSPDGMRILTASHNVRDSLSGKTKYWATIWRRFQPIGGLEDPALWTATRYCPPIKLRMELLGVSESAAAEQLASCERRVAAAFQHVDQR